MNKYSVTLTDETRQWAVIETETGNVLVSYAYGPVGHHAAKEVVYTLNSKAMYESLYGVH